MIRRVLFIAVTILQVIFLVGMVAYHQKQLDTGFPIRLKVIPVDPNDIMRGEYVHLGYEITRLDLTKLPHDPGTYEMGKDIYVTLMENTSSSNSMWQAQSVHHLPPAPKDFPFIKGKIEWMQQWSTPTSKMNEVNVTYNIEQYYVEEGRAKEIESAMRKRGQATTHQVSVDVRLTKDGTPAIAKLFVDEKEFR
jgi:uncharacterized membrane-anchored protein